jgi:hypothetical protein
MDFSDQERIFGALLGSVPTRRAATNGIVIYKGYVVRGVWRDDGGGPDLLRGQEHARDGGGGRRAGPVVRRGRTRGRTGPRMAGTIGHNRDVTWRMQPPAGKRVGGWSVRQEARLRGTRSLRRRRPPAACVAASLGPSYEYNDVRMNLLRAFAAASLPANRYRTCSATRSWRRSGLPRDWKSVPDHKQLRPAGRSADGIGQRRHPLGRRRLDRTRGISRVLVTLARGGRWNDRALLPPDFVKSALSPSAHGPDVWLPLVAEHAGEELPRPAADGLWRARGREQRSRFRPSMTSWWCGAGTAATKPSSSSA